MSYQKAINVLPKEIIEVIQNYIDGEYLYIPRKSETKKAWGESTTTRQELKKRNHDIYKDYLRGMCTSVLAETYYLSEKSIQRILRNEKTNYEKSNYEKSNYESTKFDSIICESI